MESFIGPTRNEIFLSGLNLFKVGWSLNHTEVDHDLVKSILYKKGGRELF